MRLFTGLSISEKTLGQMEAILSELKPTADLRWSPPRNLHLTLSFIGKWEESRLPELIAALSKVQADGPLPVEMTGFGFFPNPHHPHTLFLAVRNHPGLTALAKNIEAALTALGCKPDDRTWHPHVTLARIARENITQLRFQIASMNTLFPLEGSTATHFHLYESRPTPSGSVYSKLASFPLGVPLGAGAQ